METIKREAIYLWYYFDIQFRQIAAYWILGMALGSFVSVFGKEKIHALFARMGNTRIGILGILPASLLGIASPLCMYGTIPLAASFASRGMRSDWLAAFMMSSILLNPQLLFYSAALGLPALLIRFTVCFLGGIAAGLLIYVYTKRGESYSKASSPVSPRPFFNFSGFTEGTSRDTDPHMLFRYLKNFGRNIRATGLYFLIGIALSAVFQRYVPPELFEKIFVNHRGFGLLMAATMGVPLYMCGGGTIPLLQEWLLSGMSLGSAASFMITGPATKITNLGAVKIILGMKHFILYLAFSLVFALTCGFIIDFAARVLL